MKIKQMLLATVLMISGAACTSETIERQPTVYTEDLKTVTVSAKEPNFVIKLKSNPTTGYTWTFKSEDDKLVVMTKHQYLAPKKGLMGAGGFDEWQFTAEPAFFDSGNEIKMNFVYARHWEKNKPGKEIEFTVKKG